MKVSDNMQVFNRFDINGITFTLEMSHAEDYFILTSLKKPVDDNQRPVVEFFVDEHCRIFKYRKHVATLNFTYGKWEAQFGDGTTTRSCYSDLPNAVFQILKFLV